MNRLVLLCAALPLLAACPSGNDGEPDECVTDTPLTTAECIEADRYQADLELVAAERDPGSSHWQRVQDLCRDRFTELGYDVEMHDYGTGINVVGTRLGTSQPDEFVLVSAHYDHIPDCAGANDNASGVAGVLEIARVLALTEHDRTLVVACWDEEELGLIGSDAYATRADGNGDDIVASFVFDMIGFKNDAPNTQSFPDGFDLLYPDEHQDLIDDEFRADFITLIHDSQSFGPAEAFEDIGLRLGLDTTLLSLGDGLKNSPLVADFRRSDHAPFWFFDYPAIFVTDSGEFRSGTYHCRDGLDVVDLLDKDFTAQVLGATTGALVEQLAVPAR